MAAQMEVMSSIKYTKMNIPEGSGFSIHNRL